VALLFVLMTTSGSMATEATDAVIRRVMIEPATAEAPRSDTASVAELADGSLMVVYHKYEAGEHAGHDRDLCRIWSKTSFDGGLTWEDPRLLIDVTEGDMNVQAPGLLRTKSGTLLMNCLRAHKGGGSSTMCLFSSGDGGKTFTELDPLWRVSKGQLPAGGSQFADRTKVRPSLAPVPRRQRQSVEAEELGLVSV
jgi:sialidase-1